MMVPMISGPSLRDARGLRFLVLLIGGWTLIRVMANWSPAYPLPNADPARAMDRFAAKPPVQMIASVGPVLQAAETKGGRPRWLGATIAARPESRPSRSADVASSWLADNRHFLRFALANNLIADAPRVGGTLALVAGALARRTAPNANIATGDAPEFWMTRDLTGWSLSGWVYVRESGGSRQRLSPSPQLGASQAGMRIAYGLGASGRLRAFGRATVALGTPAQSEVAIGAAFAPMARIPIDVTIERRIAIGQRGRNALAAMVSGGVSGAVLPHGFRLDAYGAAGVVGLHRQDGFADGSVSAMHDLGRLAGTQLRAGGFAAGAIQRDAGRVDVGPRLSVRLPEIGKGSRITVDWRQRVAGDALPTSGVALTLAADF